MTALARSYVLLTGSELVRGDIRDANGGFLARELTRLGLPPERLVVVGDDPAELTAAIEEGLRTDMLVVSGGLGPTHDDRTVALLASVAGLETSIDPGLVEEIGRTSRRIAERLGMPYQDFEPGVRKQATLPEGAEALGLAGTAPGLILRAGATVVVVLPGPPGELRRLWPNAARHGWVGEVAARNPPRNRRLLRFFGVSESAVARALEEAGGEARGVEVGICARDFEIHVDIAATVEGEDAAASLEGELALQLARHLFARDEEPIESMLLKLCIEHELTLASAESCTGGLVGARLTGIAGASQAFRGAVVAYDNDVKMRTLDVPEQLLAARGAVSAEVAEAMAHGVRQALGVDVGISITGIAGPGGGTAEKPVGLVYLHASAGHAERGRELHIPGDRTAIRDRAAAAALHLTRRVVAQSRAS
jgi:nicotinamide-nucleotide amidase